MNGTEEMCDRSRTIMAVRSAPGPDRVRERPIAAWVSVGQAPVPALDSGDHGGRPYGGTPNGRNLARQPGNHYS